MADMATCGDIDGKPCEFWFSCGIPHADNSRPCMMVAALLECRRERDDNKGKVVVKNLIIALYQFSATAHEVWLRNALYDRDKARGRTDELAQKLADSPCPGCYATQAFCEPGTRFRPGPPDDDIESCPHCGDFPKQRRGLFAIDAEDALRRVKEEQDAQPRTDQG